MTRFSFVRALQFALALCFVFAALAAQAASYERKDVTFVSQGLKCAAWYYVPNGLKEGEKRPAIVMAHGFSAVKEQRLDTFAEAFCKAGFAVLVFDNRNFGASDGTPRQEIDPIRQIRDYRHAITYAETRPELDRTRIGIWGTSYSGGHVLVAAAIDRRVKCVVAQVPTISGSQSARRRTRGDRIAGQNAAFDADRRARFAGKPPRMIPVVASDDAPCALAGKDAYQFFMGEPERAPAFRNEVTLASAEMSREYEPGLWIEAVSPTPLLMILAREDWLTPTDLSLGAYQRAREPKRLVLLPGGHFVPYIEQFSESSGAATAWFQQHLCAG